MTITRSSEAAAIGLTVGDMLDRVSRFEARLEACYADIRERAESDGVRLLTHYLARHRAHLPSALEPLSREQLAALCAEPLTVAKQIPDPVVCFAGDPIPSAITGDDLLGVAIGLVEALTAFYEQLTDLAIGEGAHDLFGRLLRAEEEHLTELRKLKAMHYF